MQATHDWIGRINQKQRQLSAIGLSEEHQQRLARLIEIEFAYSTLKLEGLKFGSEQIELERYAQLKSGEPARPGDRADEEAALLLESLTKVTSLARTHGIDASLTPELLLELHNARGSDRAAVESPTANPVPPEHLLQVLAPACQWFSADSFRELHPIEQASIVLLRLIELRPFEQANERTALIAASLFMLRSRLPPIIIKPETEQAYRAALNEGLLMNTRPMVEFIAESVEKSLDEMILQAQE